MSFIENPRAAWQTFVQTNLETFDDFIKTEGLWIFSISLGLVVLAAILPHVMSRRHSK